MHLSVYWPSVTLTPSNAKFSIYRQSLFSCRKGDASPKSGAAEFYNKNSAAFSLAVREKIVSLQQITIETNRKDNEKDFDGMPRDADGLCDGRRKEKGEDGGTLARRYGDPGMV
jgi:hypothetical protein